MRQHKCTILTQEDNIPWCEPGTKHVTPAGDVYRYVKAQAAKTAALVWGIDENWEVSATAVNETETYPLLGVPVTTTAAPASGYTYRYFWIQTAGNFPALLCKSAVADNAPVYTVNAGDEGKVDDGDDAGRLIRGWKFTALVAAPGNTTAFAANEQGVYAA